MTDEALQINENRVYQGAFWRIQRAAWVVMAGLLAIAFVGLTGGSGWLSHSTVGDGAFSVSYPTVLRQQTTGSFLVTVDQPDQETMLHFDTAFQDAFVITSMSPPASSALGTPTGVAYRFAFSGNGPASVRIKVETDHPATADYTIVADGHMALLSTTILP